MSPFETKEIKLGGKSFVISPPAFQALMAIMQALGSMGNNDAIKDGSDPAQGIVKMLDVIFIGIKDSCPDLERTELESLRMPMDEINQAFTDVLAISGLKQGEIQAVSR